MLSLAINQPVRFAPRMAQTISVEEAERRVLGKALAALRDRAGLTQYEAAQALNISTQAWQMYEAGRRKFTPEQIARVTGALGNTPEDLMVQRARILGQEPPITAAGLAEREARAFEIPLWGRALVGPGGPAIGGADSSEGAVDLKGLRSTGVGATRIADGSMIPWGAPGEAVIFDRDRWPKPGEGCVIETKVGDLFVKLYDHSDAGHVYARQFNPEQVVSFALQLVKGVYAIRLRGD